MRIVFVARGNRVLAPVLGFFEILIWLLAIGQIFRNLNNVFCYLAYAGGFATGNYVGMVLEEKLAMGFQVVRIITRKDASQLIEFLKNAGFGVTTIDGQGATGPVKIVFSIIRRKDQPKVLRAIQEKNPNAFFSVENIQSASAGIFPPGSRSTVKSLWEAMRFWKKGK
jgi:uncharacterized protein YebE (UPF0316 family)